MDLCWTLLLDYLRPIVLSPILMLSVALSLQEFVLASPLRRLCLFILVVFSTSFSVGFPSTASPAWSYGWGLLNAWAGLVWVPLWLWCLDARLSYLLHYSGDSACSKIWAIKKYPPTISLTRISWTLNLLTDLRGISWSHGLRKDSPWRGLRAQYPAVDTHAMKRDKLRFELSTCSRDYTSFTIDLLLRMLSLYAETELLSICSNLYMRSLRYVSMASILQAYPSSLSLGVIHLVIRAVVVATCTYCLLISIHNVITMLQMGLFLTRTKRVPPEWMFPPIFGHKFVTNLPGFWSQTWQDTFSFSLSTLSRRAKFGSAPKIVNSTLQASVAFALSGLFHAAGSFAVDKRPDSALATMCIFSIQPLAAIFQQSAFRALRVTRCPSWVTELATALFGFGWLVLTVNAVADTSAFDRVLCSFARTPSLTDMRPGIQLNSSRN